jgi:hypothetical protein
MERRFGIVSLLSAGSLVIACNALLGLEEKKLDPAGEGSGAGTGGDGQDTTGGRDTGRGGTSGAGTSGQAGANSGGEAGDGGVCTPGDEQSCRTVYPTLLGNCSRGTVTCDENGTWGPCSIEPEDADSCDDEGDDADCDGTPNGGCPCLSGETRPCGPETDDGICEFGTSICLNQMWAGCEGAVLPGPRDCRSSDDNDCDGEADDRRDAECPCASGGTHQCVADAPAEWSGPMALAEGAASSAPSCTATGYERQVLSLFGMLDEGSAACGCGCSDPANMNCPMTVDIRRKLATAPFTCLLATSYVNVESGSCTGTLADGYLYGPTAPTFSSGNCTPQPTADIETARWSRRMVACETNEGDRAGCSSGEQCLPDLVAPLLSFCIYRTGAHDCPSGAYTERTIYYEDFADGRSCTACSCGAPTGSCEGYVDFRTGSGCGSSLVERVEFGGCIQLDGSQTGVKAMVGPITAQGDCVPSGGLLQGSVSVQGAVTVCCMP